MTGHQALWICCQLGAREHYAVPRALNREGRLRLLVTDTWVPPNGVLHFIPGDTSRRLCERFHADLATAPQKHFTVAAIGRESVWRLRRRRGWDLIVDRNRWFQRRAVQAIKQSEAQTTDRLAVFAHSYSALEIFRYAKSRGWTTVLGQIDPGEEHHRIVRRVCEQNPDYGTPPQAPPASYFESWREECDLSDWIVVNSDWAREALERAGIPGRKLKVVPLPYESGADRSAIERTYPAAFTPARPLRVLFVGNVTVAKGVAALLEALDLLADVPCELTLVGDGSMSIPQRFQRHPAIRWIGSVRRSDVAEYYRNADVLIFPSLSDGFGMVQVEAQGVHLPVIASRFCGSVVTDGMDGVVLRDVSSVTIAEVLTSLAARPEIVTSYSRHSAPDSHAGLSAFASELVSLEQV